MSGRLLRVAILGLGLAAGPSAQEAQSGFTAPVTVSGGFMQSDDSYFSYHVAAHPEWRINDQWFAYAAVDVYATPFFYYPAYNARQWAHTELQQAYVARIRRGERAGWMVKAGKLATAFGSPDRQYDDMQTALLDQPLSFTSALPLYPQLNVCGSALCFRYTPSYYSYAPVTLYGVWGAEASGWWRRLDGRVQVANSSPVNPQEPWSAEQAMQWTAGAGYTAMPGLRIGVSGFRGRWLNGIAEAETAGVRTWAAPASGIGVDVEWAYGRWKARAEWQRMTFPYPAAFQTAVPEASFAWTEAKAIVTPRWYVAARVGWQHTRGFGSAQARAPNLGRYEAAVGFRPDRLQLIKVGYEWNRLGTSLAAMDNVLGVELVTAVPGFTKGR